MCGGIPYAVYMHHETIPTLGSHVTAVLSVDDTDVTKQQDDTLWIPKLTNNVLAILPGVGMSAQTAPCVFIAHMTPSIVAG